ncbi:MAG: hypothetical protein JRH11_20905, partial [Deltaproteobacteria bacterium]|nr:hypothetical protein [Deltaproteobacteria bacterium]
MFTVWVMFGSHGGRWCALGLFTLLGGCSLIDCFPGTVLDDNSGRHHATVQGFELFLKGHTRNFHTGTTRGSWGHRAYQLVIELRVDDRPGFDAAIEPTDTMLDEDEIEAALSTMEWAFSGDGEHLFYRTPSGATGAHHFLPSGPAFSAGRVVSSPADLAGLPSAEAIALELARDPSHCEQGLSLWRAVFGANDRA